MYFIGIAGFLFWQFDHKGLEGRDTRVGLEPDIIPGLQLTAGVHYDLTPGEQAVHRKNIGFGISEVSAQKVPRLIDLLYLIEK